MTVRATGVPLPDGNSAQGARQAHEPLNWRARWCAIGEARDIRALRAPRPVQLYKQDLVVWPNPDGSLSAAPDACPHARAPLSQGKLLDNGRLRCGYHGWEFDDRGTCRNNPHAKKFKESENWNLSCVPVMEESGVAYVWPDGETAALALTTPPPFLPEVFRDGGPSTTLRRTVHAPFLQAVANALDYNHIDFVHTFGKPERAKPVAYREVKSESDPHGFVFEAPDEIRTTFTAPGSVYHHVMRPPVEVHIWSQLTPSGPNRTLHVSKIAFRASATLPPWQRRLVDTALGLYEKMPRWLQHMSTMRTAEEDVAIMPHASHDRSRIGSTADRPRKAFEDWVGRDLNSAPVWLDNGNFFAPVAQAGADVIERYHQHSKDCAACRPTYERARLIEQHAPLAATALLAAQFASVTQGGPGGYVLGTLAIAVMAGGQAAGQVRRRLGPQDPPEFRR